MIAFRSRFVCLALAIIVLPACDEDQARPTSGGLRCDNTAVPTLLASKPDDEDGDGRILDEAFPEIDDEDDDIADHAWIVDATGRYHLFFHNEGRDEPWAIEHYSTRELNHVQYAGVALRAQPAGAWDAGGLWSPHVVEAGGRYYMFYTGIEHAGAGATQRIGVAVSDDLVRWERVPVNRCPGTSGDGCIYECASPWTLWEDNSDPFNDQCRDAFVMRDANADRWLMFATARSTNGFAVVTVASSADLVTWTGAGYIDATRRLASGTGAQATGGEAENPFVISREGHYILLFTDWRDPEDSLDVAEPRTIAQYATASSLHVDAGGSANWMYRGSIPDPGVNAIEVLEYSPLTFIMSQSLSNPNCGYVKPIRRMLRLKCIEWNGDGTFGTSNVGFGEENEASLLMPAMK